MRRDGFARHDNAADGNRNGEDAARPRRAHRAFRRLLFDHAAIGAQGREVAVGDVERRLRLIKQRLGIDSAPKQFLRAIEIALRLLALRLLRADALIERLHLQKKFLIDDRRDLRAAGDVIALFDLERAHGAADARPRRQLMRRLHRSDDRLEVIHRGDPDRDLSGIRAQGSAQGISQRCEERHRRKIRAAHLSHTLSYMQKT